MRSILKKWLNLMRERRAISEHPDKRIYYVKEAAEMLGIDRHRLYKAIREKELPHVFKNNCLALHIDDIKTYEKTLKRIKNEQST